MTTKIAIIEYGMGNVRSVFNAFEAVGSDPFITNNPIDLRKADGIVLPGVGAFPSGIKNLQEMNLVSMLNELVLKEEIPFLGICLGMQLLATIGHEDQTCPGLGWIEGEVSKLPADLPGLKIPHIGWNDAQIKTESNLLGQFNEIKSYYFVHSYYMDPVDKDCVVATCDYGMDFTCAIQKRNIYAVQFHAEKSQKHGLSILKNFLTRVEEAKQISHA